MVFCSPGLPWKRTKGSIEQILHSRRADFSRCYQIDPKELLIQSVELGFAGLRQKIE